METGKSLYNHEKDRFGQTLGRGPLPDKLFSTLCKCMDNTRITLEKGNPHSGKWALRYEKYKKAKTFGEMLQLGALRSDVPYDLLRGILKVHGPFRKSLANRENSVNDTDHFIAPYSYRCDPKVLRELYANEKLFVDVPALLNSPKAMHSVLKLSKQMGKNSITDIVNYTKESKDNGHKRNALEIMRKYVDKLSGQILESRKKITQAILLSVLRKWGFAENHARFNVMLPGTKWIHSDNFGVLRNRRSRPKLTSASLRYPNFLKLVAKFLKDNCKIKGVPFRYTSFCLNKNYTAKKHSDKGNFGPSVLVALGDFKGGELKYWRDPENPSTINTRNKFELIDGNVPHAVNPYRGKERYSIVYFTVKGFHKLPPSEAADVSKLTGAKYPSISYLQKVKKHTL